MLVSGIISIVLGIILTLAGNARNQDPFAFVQYGPNPGGGLITFGVLFIIAGIVILALRFWKKHRNPND